MSEVNNTQVDNVEDRSAVMPMYSLIECDDYSKTSGSFWQYYKDEPSLNNLAIAESESFKFKVRVIGNTPDNCKTEDVEIAIALKYLKSGNATNQLRN